MPAISVEVSQEIADYWHQLAGRVSLPVETWLGLCGSWGAALDLPITRIVLRQPPAAKVLDGVAWEVGVFPHLKCPHCSIEGDATVINKVILVGNLGRDPEIRSTASGIPVANLSLATNRRWKDREGDRQEQTEWHNVVCFGRQAEIAGQYLSRGRQIYVEGRIQTRSWEDRNTGETRYRTEIVCENFQMLGQREGTVEPPSATEPPLQGDPGPEPASDDIPF